MFSAACARTDLSAGQSDTHIREPRTDLGETLQYGLGNRYWQTAVEERGRQYEAYAGVSGTQRTMHGALFGYGHVAFRAIDPIATLAYVLAVRIADNFFVCCVKVPVHRCGQLLPG